MSRQKGKETKPAGEESNQKRRSKMILETSIDGFCVVGPDDKILEVNSSLCNITGYSKEELLEMKIADIEVFKTAEQAAQHIDKVMKQGYDRFETKHRRKDGKIIDIEVSTQYGDFGEDRFFFCFFRDITEKKKIEEKLKETRERLEYILSTTPATTYTCKVGDNWAATFVSENVRNQFGYEPRQFLEDANFWFAHIHPEDGQRILAELSRLFENDYHIHEYRFLHKDGSYRWVHDEVRLIRDEEGKPLECIGYWTDITERKKTEEALKESEERYKALFQGAAEGIIVADIEAKEFKYVNPAICKMLGYTEEELRGLGVRDIHPEEDLKHIISEFEAQARGEKILSSGIPCLRKDGTIMYADINTTMVLIDGRQCNVGLFTDITDRKRIKAELENYKEKLLRAQKHAYVDSVGTIVAHQINQPLTKINILLDKAIEQIEEGACSPAALNNVKEGLAEAQEAASVIRKFHQYFKDSALEGMANVNLSAVADKIASVLSKKAKQFKMRIAIKGFRDLPEVESNETALEQIFLIIIQNAIEAADGREPHKLDITGRLANGNIELQFSDDCCGIAPENLDRIFEPFFSTKSEGKGMGLGLGIVQQILISCGGQVRVESEPGNGTTFYVTLPVSNTAGV